MSFLMPGGSDNKTPDLVPPGNTLSGGTALTTIGTPSDDLVDAAAIQEFYLKNAVWDAREPFKVGLTNF